MLDLRPGALDAKYRPGSTYTLNLNGPAGWLATRVFAASLGELPLTVTEQGDTLQIVVPDTVTSVLKRRPYEFVLDETNSNVQLVGKWTPSEQGQPDAVIDTVVLFQDIQVEVVIGGPAGPEGQPGDPGEGAVQSVNSETGVVVLDASDIGAEPAGAVATAVAPLDARLDALEAAPSGGSYEHSQGSPSATWVIVHNLGFKPQVTVFDSGGNEWDGDPVHDSVNQLTLQFNVPFGGTAYLS